MSADDLSKARSWYAACGNDNLVAAKYLGQVFRHLRALTAPADGEALGRELLRQIELPADRRPTWIEIALHLHAIGHDAGALSREGEIAAWLTANARAGLITVEQVMRFTAEQRAEVLAWIADTEEQVRLERQQRAEWARIFENAGASVVYRSTDPRQP